MFQEQPEKVCSRIGLCAFDGTRGVRLNFIFIFIYYYFFPFPFLHFLAKSWVGIWLLKNFSIVYPLVLLHVLLLACSRKISLPIILNFECSIGIESIIDNKVDGSANGQSDAMCSSCEMAVLWMQNQLLQNKSENIILDYADQV